MYIQCQDPIGDIFSPLKCAQILRHERKFHDNKSENYPSNENAVLHSPYKLKIY